MCWGKRRVARKRASSGEQHTPPMWHVTGSATAAPTPLPVAHGHPHAACHRVGTSVLQHGGRGWGTPAHEPEVTNTCHIKRPSHHVLSIATAARTRVHARAWATLTWTRARTRVGALTLHSRCHKDLPHCISVAVDTCAAPLSSTSDTRHSRVVVNLYYPFTDTSVKLGPTS